jgi:hypothetical protein
MRLINHSNHINQISPSSLRKHIAARFNQLSEDTDTPASLILLESTDDPRNSDLCFIGSNGLLSDYYDEHNPGEEGFTSPFEWVSRWPDLKIWEVLYLEFDMGTWLIIPDEVVTELNPELLLALTAQELSDPQPLN